jgi:DNA-3-methyladenine glycosylase I
MAMDRPGGARCRLGRKETMPDLTPRRSRVQAASAVVIAALVWLAASVGTIAPVAASDPTATPTPTPTATPTPTPNPTPVPTVTFYGRGYGHGIGMSQYGARGRALAGQTAPQILAHYYIGTTPGIVPTSTAIRVLVVSGFKPTTTYPAKVIAHAGTFTVDGVTGTWPAEASATLVLTTTPTAGWRLDIVSKAGKVLRSAASPSSVRIRPAASATTFQVWFDPSYYDTFRGVVRLIGSSTGTVSAVNETSLESYLRGVVPVEMPSTWPAEALKVQAIAARSYAGAHLHPTTGTYDMTDSSQAYRGVLAEKATTTAAVVATAGQVLRSGGHIIIAMYHSADGGATENNENVYVSATGVVVNPPVAYLRGEPDRPFLRRRLATRDLAHRDIHVRPAVDRLRLRPADGRRDPHRHRFHEARRVGPGHRRPVDGLARQQDRVGRHLPVGLQHVHARRRPVHVEHARRDQPDPVSGARALDDRPRCWWAGADLARADPLMVAYHDDEWGTPTHDDVELFERLVLESFQAGLSWSTILRKREAFRTAFRGFDPTVVAAFGAADRARLMADAGIVRNGAKIDATIGNAAATLALASQHGSFDAYLGERLPGPVPRLGRDAARGGIPVTTPAAEALSADLRRHGFRFVGPTIVYSFMESVGLVDDHLPGCFRYVGPSARD